MIYSVAAQFNEPDIRKIAALPYPMLRGWLAYRSIENKEHERMMAEAKQQAEMQAALQNMPSDPYFRRPR